MQKLAESRGGKCLSKEYVNTKRKIIWQCGNGHTWEASPQSVKQGGWCQYCANIQLSKERRLDFNIVLHKIKELDGEYISGKYRNNQSKLFIRCKEGHEWQTNYANIQNGRWCPICARIKQADRQRGNIDEMKEIAKQRGGICISEKYVDSHTPLNWSCAEGHEWFSSPLSVKNQGTWCPECNIFIGEKICKEIFTILFNKKFRKARPEWLINPKTGRCMELDGYNKELKLAFEHHGIQHYFQDEKHFHKVNKFRDQQERDIIKKKLCAEQKVKLVVIPYYVHHNRKLQFIIDQCKSYGYKIDNIPLELYDFKNLSIYKKERLKEIREIAESKGGKCLNESFIDYQTKMKFQCENGHIFSMSSAQIKYHKSWCLECAGIKRYTKNDMIKLSKSRNGKFLSDDFTNVNEIHEWQCSKGHRWKTRPGNIIKGHWCPHCAGQGKLSIELMKQIASERGGECLSDVYVNAKTKLHFKCENGHEWWAQPYHIKKGAWCHYCSGRRKWPPSVPSR